MSNKYSMQYKYANTPIKQKARSHLWITGPDPLTHEKFYAWHKHRSQANYRKEEYLLTFDDWQQLWPDEKFLNRGRDRDSFVLTRIERDGPWSIANCEVVTRYDQLKRCIDERISGRASGKNYSI